MDNAAEIKARLNIMDLAHKLDLEVNQSGFVKSVFNPADKNPSMKLYPRTNTFKDYSSGEQGDVIDLYKYMYNVDFQTAVHDLCILCGIVQDQKPKREFAPNIKPFPSERAVLAGGFESALSSLELEYYNERLGMLDGDPKADEKAQHMVKMQRLEKNTEVFEEFFCYCVVKGSSPKAMDYLVNKRKLKESTLKRFKIFVIDNYYEVNNHLKKTFPLEQLQACGLYNKKEDGSGNLIFYNHRIIIPYIHKGRIVYLRGRYFDQENNFNTDGNKYLGPANDALNLNTPKRFFNTDVLKNMLQDERLFLVEGELDTCALEQIGFNTLGIPGAGNMPALGSFHKITKFRVTACVDNDPAGQKLLTGKYVDHNGQNKYSEHNLTAIFKKLNKELFIKQLSAKDINDFLVKNG